MADRVHVAFKALHEDIDSFGGLPYKDGGEGRVSKRPTLAEEKAIACVMGCAAAPWTGSLILKQSAIEGSLGGSRDALDMDAPPDVLAAVADHRDRGLTSLTDVLRPCKRLFVCGLALDFCVMDTCVRHRHACPSSCPASSRMRH